MLLIIDNYDSFTYNLYQYFCELGAHCQVVRNHVPLDTLIDLRPHFLVISPGPGNPDQAGVSLAAIAHFAGKIPILGVCLGHQAIAQAFGGQVVRAPRPVHGKLTTLTHQAQGIFHKLPPSFEATRYHSLVVARETLPACLEVTATNKEGLIMGLRHRHLAIEGLQFHPESYATANGHQLLANFLQSKEPLAT